MLLKIAWQNVWRNKVRSLVVITAVALGLWAGVFASAFVKGMMKKKVENVIKLEMSDFQIHQPNFRDELSVKLFIPNPDDIQQNIEQNPQVIATTSRLISQGMISSSASNGSIKIVGVNPEKEAATTGINELLIEGKYFEGSKRNPVLISKKIAEEYRLKLRSKAVLTIQDVEGEIIAGAFRVVGIFESENSMFDKQQIFVRQKDLGKLIKIERGSHEIAVLLNDHDAAEAQSLFYQGQYPDLEIKPWLDLSTGMRFMVEAMDVYLFYIVGIILLALLFSILNTMLMAVLERVREIGMLMAIGMAKGKIFVMILLETLILSMIGGPLGLLLSYGFVEYFGKHGINLEGAAYEDAGFSSIVYPYLDGNSYLNVAVMVFIMALLAAIYPAQKALKLNPVEAIRKI
jgi:ABC-type lipoprotein release transport system permease subunit